MSWHGIGHDKLDVLSTLLFPFLCCHVLSWLSFDLINKSVCAWSSSLADSWWATQDPMPSEVNRQLLWRRGRAKARRCLLLLLAVPALATVALAAFGRFRNMCKPKPACMDHHIHPAGCCFIHCMVMDLQWIAGISSSWSGSEQKGRLRLAALGEATTTCRGSSR